ncbi:amino acid ABC transporter, permease protein, partial [gut metagenome]
MFTSPFFGGTGDQAWQVRERAKKRRERTIQALLLLFLVGVIASAVMNVSANLEARNIHNGFAFLFEPAGFDIGETLVPFSSSDQLIRAFLIGILNTIKVSLIAIVGATVLGVIVGMMRLSRHPMLRILGMAHVEAYRNVPLLVLLLMLYLVVTELLPGGKDALHLGNWVYLSKAGLQFVYPVMGLTALMIAVAIGFLGAVITRYFVAKKTTGLIANCWAVVVFGFLGIISWCGCGVVGGWEHPIATRFALRG